MSNPTHPAHRATSVPTDSGASSALGAISIGKIVRSESHVRYTCQVFGPGENPGPPEPADYAFGSFVRVPLRIRPTRPDVAQLAPANSASFQSAPRSDALIPRERDHNGHLVGRVPLPLTGEGDRGWGSWSVGLIYDTILLNPAFGMLGPRLSSDEQVTLFSPDYLSERAVLVSILLLGSVSAEARGPARISHGVPPVAPDLGAVVSSMSDAEVRAFHFFADGGAPGGARAYLHMGYLPHAVAQDHPLLPLAMLSTIERLERLCPENAALLAIVKRNFAWRLKVQATG